MFLKLGEIAIDSVVSVVFSILLYLIDEIFIGANLSISHLVSIHLIAEDDFFPHFSEILHLAFDFSILGDEGLINMIKFSLN